MGWNSKSKKVKLPKNSKGHYLAMQRRKKSLFKKASELSTLCGIDVCIIVYDDQNPKTTIETWPHSCNDVFRMVKRCKGRMSEDREKKLKKEKILSDVHSAQIQSQTHSDFSSEMQSKDVPYDIENVCSPTDIILEDKECCNNLDESIVNLCCTDFVAEEQDILLPDWLIALEFFQSSSHFCNGLDEANTSMAVQEDHPEGSILLGAISHGKPSSVVMEGRKNPEKLPMCHPISYLVPPNKTDISKSKKVKLPKNSKGHPLAMQRRKKSLFKKASELSTLCGIDRRKGRMSEDREKKLRKEKILSDVHSAQIQSQTHSDFSSEIQSKDMPYDIKNVCSPNDIILEDKECFNNLDESILKLSSRSNGMRSESSRWSLIKFGIEMVKNVHKELSPIKSINLFANLEAKFKKGQENPNIGFSVTPSKIFQVPFANLEAKFKKGPENPNLGFSVTPSKIFQDPFANLEAKFKKGQENPTLGFLKFVN
ncbi:Transcription factor, MADS-box [Dillenia turbinata]|uniref:Transcription factor, MADS-box n=1 Tax=Dillenia turbinata TaxID=194707 RepID=A0AAN8Z2F5_9MAGN